MSRIQRMTAEDVERCVLIYRAAYASEPWKEEYTEAEVGKYLSEFMNSDSRHCFVLAEDGKIIGLALTILIPGMDAPYLRVEDFCIDVDMRRKGYGSRLMNLLMEKAREMGCDSILLGTQKEFPAYRFYLKNGFQEIESVLLYREIGQ